MGKKMLTHKAIEEETKDVERSKGQEDRLDHVRRANTAVLQPSPSWPEPLSFSLVTFSHRGP
ncbi:unnamed protein product, partial [Thlaspi arvense]